METRDAKFETLAQIKKFNDMLEAISKEVAHRKALLKETEDRDERSYLRAEIREYSTQARWYANRVVELENRMAAL